MNTKKEYIQTVRKRYQATNSKLEKSIIIDEVQSNLRKDRKHIIKILGGKYYKKYRVNNPRGDTYTYDLIKPLKIIWEANGKRSSKNLKPQIPELLAVLKKFNEIEVNERQEILLTKMSTGTIDKLLGPIKRKDSKKYGLSGTKTSPLLKTLIPIRTTFDDVHEPGHIEQDCVLHCGTSVAGIYAETLNSLDIFTHWNEQTIFLKKTQTKVVGAFHDQRNRFPFEILSTDFDNGFEFVNWTFHKYCKENNISFTRSRPYKKNDQAHIEGKNYQAIRRVIGYERITQQDIVDHVNDMYQNELSLLNNFFYATQKLKKKERVNGRIRKVYEKAKTPYARVMECKNIDVKTKMMLAQQYSNLNPMELQGNLHVKKEKLKKMISVSKLNWATTP
jgi:hypothetical protein